MQVQLQCCPTVAGWCSMCLSAVAALPWPAEHPHLCSSIHATGFSHSYLINQLLLHLLAWFWQLSVDFKSHCLIAPVSTIPAIQQRAIDLVLWRCFVGKECSHSLFDPLFSHKVAFSFSLFSIKLPIFSFHRSLSCVVFVSFITHYSSPLSSLFFIWSGGPS